MASIKTNTEVTVDIDIDVECSTCGSYMDVYIRDTRIMVEPCSKCFGKLEEEIESLKDKLEES